MNLVRVGEVNGNLLQYSCLENPRDREAWWAAVYGVAQSQTRLKQLSSSSSSSNLDSNLSSITYYPESLRKNVFIYRDRVNIDKVVVRIKGGKV